MKKQVYKVFTVMGMATVMAFGLSASLANEVTAKSELTLTATGLTDGPYGLTGQAGQVAIRVDTTGHSVLEFSVSGLKPNGVYTVWLELDTQKAPFSGTPPNFVATDPQTGTTADVFGFAPAAPDNAGFTAGNGLDPNGFITDDSGNAKFTIKLNYDIFQTGAAPVVLRPGLIQAVPVSPDPESGLCTASDGSSFPSGLDTGYMRVFDTSTVADPPGVSPSYQVLDGQLKPRLVRGNVSGLIVAEHFDGLTHGHRPGLHIGNPAAAGCGDWEGRLQGDLADAHGAISLPMPNHQFGKIKATE
jgi:hypothetical protein